MVDFSVFSGIASIVTATGGAAAAVILALGQYHDGKNGGSRKENKIRRYEEKLRDLREDAYGDDDDNDESGPRPLRPHELRLATG